MKEATILVFSLGLLSVLLMSCNNNKVNVRDNNNIDRTKNISLTEKKILGSGYCISIPIDYSIIATDGPDFSVFYFSPTDIMKKPA